MIRMQELVHEAMSVGALGFATSRTLVQRRGDGEFIPSCDADSEELVGIAATVGKTGRGVLQMIPNLDTKDYVRDVNLLISMAKASGRPVTYSLAQWSGDPKGWRTTLDIMGESNDKDGTALTAKVFPRPLGVIGGPNTSVNPFSLRSAERRVGNTSVTTCKFRCTMKTSKKNQ